MIRAAEETPNPNPSGDGPTSAAQQPATPQELPKPRVKKTRWPFPLIWLVPVAAAIVFGIYMYRHMRGQGPVVQIAFNDAEGVRIEETTVRFRGVEIGKVSDMKLSDDGNSAIVEIRLQRAARHFALKGSRFWIVRPDISATSISGLGTIVTGPYIQALPGEGEKVTQFHGLPQAPPPDRQGLHIVLETSRVEHLQADSPVYFRDIQVGVVENFALANDATHVNVAVLIDRPYANLVHEGTQFWQKSGAEIKGGVFTGLDVKLGSLRSMMVGGVALATPERDMGRPAGDGMHFILHDDAKSEWLKWSPKIPIGP